MLPAHTHKHYALTLREIAHTRGKQSAEYIDMLMPIYLEIHKIQENLQYKDEGYNYSVKDLNMVFLTCPYWNTQIDHSAILNKHPYERTLKELLIVPPDEDLYYNHLNTAKLLSRCQGDALNDQEQIVCQILLSLAINDLVTGKRHGDLLTYDVLLKYLGLEKKCKDNAENATKIEAQFKRCNQFDLKIFIPVFQEDYRDASLAGEGARCCAISKNFYESCTSIVDPEVLWDLEIQYEKNLEEERSRECVTNKGSRSKSRRNASNAAKRTLSSAVTGTDEEKYENAECAEDRKPHSRGQWNADRAVDCTSLSSAVRDIKL